MTKEFEAYMEITEKCAVQCEAMLADEREKRQALLSDDMKRLEVALQNQQAATMSLEALEKKRRIAQGAAGYLADATASQILESMEEGSEKEQFGSVLGRLGRTAEELKEMNKTAVEIARTNLQMFSHLSQAAKPEKQATYRPGQQKGTGWTGGSAFEQKI